MLCLWVAYVVQDNEGLCPAAISIADGVESSTANNGGKQLLNEKHQDDGADNREDKIVNQKESLQLEGLPVAHQLSATKNDEIVDGDKNGSVSQRRHGRLANDKLELIRGIPCHILKRLVKERPQVDAKRPVHAGNG